MQLVCQLNDIFIGNPPDLNQTSVSDNINALYCIFWLVHQWKCWKRPSL